MGYIHIMKNYQKLQPNPTGDREAWAQHLHVGQVKAYSKDGSISMPLFHAQVS